jgi:hypothetical protein
MPCHFHSLTAMRVQVKLAVLSLDENASRLVNLWSRGNSVSIVSDYGLDDRGSIPDKGRGFFF